MGLEIRVDGDLVSAAAAIQRLTPPLTVITGINPWIDRLPEQVREARLEALRGAFIDRGLVPRECWATSAAGATFAGWAAEGLQLRAARKFGRQLKKGVVFHLTEDRLRVIGCSFPWELKRPLGGIRPSKPGKTLVDATRDRFGFAIEMGFKRAAMRGWDYEHTLERPCPTCEKQLEVFGADLTSRAGTPCRATSFLCRTCKVARLPHQVPGEYRELNQCLRNLATAKRDADRAGRTEPNHWAYVIELKDEVGVRTGNLPWIYVGESAKSPEERFAEHRAGIRDSGVVHRHWLKLRPDLYEGHPILRSDDEAEAYEKLLATRLCAEGYSIKGGH